MEEKKDNNTTLTVIIIIAAALIIGLVGYFIYNQTKDEEVKEPEVTDNGTKDTETNDIEEKSVAGAYSGKYNKNSNVVEDAADTVTDNTEDRVVVELVLDEDGKATFIKAGDTEETIKGTYTSTDTTVTLTATEDKDDTTDSTTDGHKTYEFTINADGTLSYKDNATSTDTVTLTKTDKSKLKYYK